MQQSSRFNQGEIAFMDTRACGGVSVRGIELPTDEEGFIYGPASLEKELEPHGFVPKHKLTDEHYDARIKAIAENKAIMDARSKKIAAATGRK